MFLYSGFNFNALQSPNATSYYKRLIDKIKLCDVDVEQTRNKIKNMRKKYTEALNWKSKTGQGVDRGSVEGKN